MDSRNDNSMAMLGKAFGILMEFAVGILVFIGLGWLGDWWLGTEPWLVIVGMLVGFGGGMYRMMRELKSLGGGSRAGGDSGGDEGDGGG